MGLFKTDAIAKFARLMRRYSFAMAGTEAALDARVMKKDMLIAQIRAHSHCLGNAMECSDPEDIEHHAALLGWYVALAVSKRGRHGD